METCSNLSRLTNIPADEIANAPVGKVLILNSGQEPMIVPRYDTFNSPEYKQYQQVLRDLRKKSARPGKI